MWMYVINVWHTKSKEEYNILITQQIVKHHSGLLLGKIQLNKV